MKRFFLKNAIVALSITAVLLIGASFRAAPAPTQPRQLSLSDRVAYQYAIEEVYWRHRIWPKENPGQKPPLDEVMPAAEIEKKVEDCLRNSQLLVSYWQRPITAEQLQAEMDRMASQTKQPEVLQELFAALDNDPFVIAECLARPILSERLAKQFYAHDERIHGDLKRRAESELLGCQSVAEMKQTSGTYSEIEWIRGDNQTSSTEIDNSIVGHAHRLPTQDSAAPKAFGAAPQRRDQPNAIGMTSNEWDESIRKLATLFDGKAGRERPQLARRGEGASTARENDTSKNLERIQVGALGPLEEDDPHYYANAVLKKDKDRLKLATVSWPKAPFESWATKAEMQLQKATSGEAGVYTLPAIANFSTRTLTSDCNNDTWTPTEVSYSYPAGRYNHTAVWTGSEMILWGGYDFDPLNTGLRYNPSTNTWVPTSSTNAPAPRYGHTAVWTGSEMIVWGGWIGSFPKFNSGGRYNPSTDSWVATTTTNVPDARLGCSAVWTGSEMIIWGGVNANNVNSGGRYNPTTDTWIATTLVNAPTARQNHTAVWTGSEMIVWGGGTNTGGRYNPGADTWLSTSVTNAPASRHNHSAVWTGSEMIIWGGFGEGATPYENSGGRYNPNTGSWVATSLMSAPTARSYPTAVWTGSEMIVWGGYNGNYLITGARYNSSTDSWIALPTISLAPRGGYTAVWTGSEMIIWGGSNGSNNYEDTGGRYNPSTNSWILLSSTNTPSWRYNHIAVWTGSEMIIWGGTGGQGTGGRYNPAADSWIGVSRTIVRSSPTAIWTGTEMILWGGWTGTYWTFGSRYQPSTDTWTDTNTNNAPVGRELLASVWTGTEMIVWGGWNGAYVNTGGRYNPSADSWAAVPVSNAPTARRNHTAVWTGNEMIVWGGSNGSSNLNSGGRYNPSTGTWNATTANSVPGTRTLHRAIWTGNEMIVWGGWNGSIDLNTGGRYNPSTDSWVATSATNAPSPRDTHATIWTGSEMIVWGGDFYDGSDHYLNTGARYNPNTDSWISTTTTNAPSGRDQHTAVWTGNEMIVWGGYNDANGQNTGGKYCAQPAAPVAQSVVSRRVHGLSGTFNIDLPLTGTPGIECRTGGSTNDYSIVVTFASAVTVNGSPQAQVISGVGTVGSGGVSNGGMVTISGNSVTVALTNVANSQTINVRLNGVTGSSGSGNITIPMSILVGDANANSAVNSGDVAQTKARLGQTLDATNFRSDVNANGAINAGDVSQIKSLLGTGLP